MFGILLVLLMRFALSLKSVLGQDGYLWTVILLLIFQRSWKKFHCNYLIHFAKFVNFVPQCIDRYLFCRGDLVTVMKDIKKHSFFWGSYQRKRFFVCDLPFALRSSDFKKDVEASSTLCTIPWDTDPYSGLLQDMNQYRALHKKHAYDGSKKTGFCSFCSGLYSHEFELPVVQACMHVLLYNNSYNIQLKNSDKIYGW